MSEGRGGHGGKKGKGRGKRQRGRGRGGQQQPRQSESAPGGLQQRRDEQQGATALLEPQKQPATESKQPQQSQQQSHDSQQKHPQQKQPQQKQHPKHHPDKTDGAGTSKPQEKPQQPTAVAQKAGAKPKTPQGPPPQPKTPQGPPPQPKTPQGPPPQPKTAQGPPPQPKTAQGPPPQPKTPQVPPQPETPQSPSPPSDSRAQPSTQPQPSKTTTKPAPPQQPQPPSGAAKPETPVQKRGSPPRSDRAVPKPPRRPDSGGKSGRPIQLRANFLPVKIPVNDIHHYDTDISAKGKKKDEGYTKSEAPRIIKEVVKIYEKENPSGPKLVYDRNGKNMYCRTPIPGFGPTNSKKYTLPSFTTDNGKEQEFTVEIKWAGKVSLYDLNEALEGRYTEIPFDTVRAIQVVLQHMPKMRSIQVRSSFFDYPTGREKDLGGGLQVWNGTFVSIRPTQWKMMLNVYTCSTAFYKAQSVPDFMCEFLNFRNYPRRLDEKQRRKFAKEIKQIKIETTHMKRKQKASGLSVKSARDEMFDCEGKKMSVLNYFKEKYHITLQYPDLPCVKIGTKGSCIPMELCRVVDCQKKQGKLSGSQTEQMIRHTAIPAPDRMQKIMELIRKLHYEDDPYCRDFGISIGKEMATIEGRVLDPPVLMYGPGNRPGKEVPRDGTWKITKQMLDPKELKEWALISYINDDPRKKRPRRYNGPDYLNDQGIDFFVNNLVGAGKEKGFRINQNPCFVRSETGFHGTDNLFGDLKARYPNLQLVVVILPIDGDDFYEEVKHCGDVVHGITTQCIKIEKASEDFSDWRKRETLVNLCLKINAKLGGTACALHREVKSPILRRPVIIFGADVTHPSAGDKSAPSIAAVVASKDSYPTLYNAEVRVQKHRKEMIEDLKEMVKELLKKFRASTKAIPEKIIFYRDGVSEGQFKEVLTDELYAIQRACVELKSDYTPAITFIVVQKRHHARFFAVNPKDQRGKSMNIPAGTVVDKHICHPFEYNWYLCSHAGIQGTSKPALYHVLYDDSNFKSDDLQILTNQLCYTYVRCARSVSIPAPTYYAHHVAFRARHHLKLDSSAEGSQASDDSGPREITQETRNLVTVHPNVNCTMYFA